MKIINQQSVDLAFASGAVQEVTVHMASEKEWFFTFEAVDVSTGRVETFSLETQRGSQRCWADPRRLFQFLMDRQVYGGRFNLKEDKK